MSRIGKLPITIPEKVDVSIDGSTVTVKGPKGELTKKFVNEVSFDVDDGQIKVSPANKTRFANAMYGTSRSIVNGMVEGVVNGFTKEIEISGVGYNATLKGKALLLKLGFSHDINYDIPEGDDYGHGQWNEVEDRRNRQADRGTSGGIDPALSPGRTL